MNTRFRPTPNSYPHIGHAWVAWKNYEAARGTGGEFNLIFDDLTHKAQCLDLDSVNINHIKKAWVEQLTWLFGEPPDKVLHSADNTERHTIACEELGIRIPRQRGVMRFTGDPVHEATINANPLVISATHPWLVVARVVDDFEANVTGFIRGMDLIGEMGLYEFISQRLGGRTVRQLYIPTVTREQYKAGAKESKSNGAASLFDLRDAGYQPGDIIDTLEECDRVRTKSGGAQVVIPGGVLEPGNVIKMSSNVANDAYELARTGAAGLPHEMDVALAIGARVTEGSGNKWK